MLQQILHWNFSHCQVKWLIRYLVTWLSVSQTQKHLTPHNIKKKHHWCIILTQTISLKILWTLNGNRVTWKLRGLKVCSDEGKDNRTDIHTAVGDPRALRQQSDWVIPALDLAGGLKNEALLGFIWKPQLTLTQHRPQDTMTQWKAHSYSSYKLNTTWQMCLKHQDSLNNITWHTQTLAPGLQSLNVCRLSFHSPKFYSCFFI